MTEETMKDLLTRHDDAIIKQDTTIKALVISVEHLVSAQTETNEQLKDISKYLAKQAIFSNKLETIDREIKESFERRDKELVEKTKRIHLRIDEMDVLQKSENGCNSVRLLHKDVESLTRDMTRLIGVTEEHRMSIEQLDKNDSNKISPTTIRWAVGLTILYSISFGTYVVQAFSKVDAINSRITVLLERNIKDTTDLMHRKDR